MFLSSTAADRETWIAFVAILVATVGWVAIAGKDLSWDVENHHLYLPFAWLNGRFATDFFGAGLQAYQNPIGYLPFYALVRVGLPAWAVGLSLCVLHSLGVFAICRLAMALWPATGDARRWHWISLAVALAWVAPSFLILAGTSSTDPLTAALVIAALVLVVLPGDPARPPSRTLLANLGAGALMGVACAVKLSNGVFVVALLVTLVWRMALRQGLWTHLLAFGGAGVLAAVPTLGPWSWALWKEFGNPVFPLFNNIFRSPYATTEPLLAARFVAQDYTDYITRLWDMALMKQFVYAEAFLPDLRPIALVVLGLLALLLALLRRLSRNPTIGADSRGRLSIDAQLVVFTLVGYVLWLKTSGNARYALPLLMVTGVLLTRAAVHALPRLWATVTLVVIVVVQFFVFVGADNWRFRPIPWTGHDYYDVSVPSVLRDEPFLHVSLGVQTHASIAPYLHPAGAMVNPIGQFALPMDGPLGEQLRSRLSQWRGRTRVLTLGFDWGSEAKRQDFERLMTATLYRLGLDIDSSDCLPITIGGTRTNPDAPAADVVTEGKTADPPSAGSDSRNGIQLHSCRAVPARPDPSFERERVVVDKVFALIEQSCPALYGPRSFVSDRGVGIWRRFYTNTDANVNVSFVDGVFMTHFRSPVDRYMGSVEELLAGKGRFDCRPLNLLTPE